jgi:anti-anti-sigma factor
MSRISVENQSFQIHRHGDVVVVVPSPEVENMPDGLIDQAAQLVLAPLKENPPTGVIIDLTKINYVGSVFISFLLRCHVLVKKHTPDGELVLAGVSDRVRELLRITSLDTLWALYDTLDEALEALSGD